MTKDDNKGITSISYNHLNLPTNVILGGGNISYIYDAIGTKLRKEVNGGNTTTTDYAGNYIYENGSLKFFSHGEGYVDADNGYEYVYQYKDHLGNVRLSYKNVGTISAPNLQIQEENNYYPFGLQHKGYNNVINGTEHPYTYNGKEEQNELGLNWLDYGWRNYDASLGRFMSPDPVAPEYPEISPYVYVRNNPVFLIDPDGRDWEISWFCRIKYREFKKVLFLGITKKIFYVQASSLSQSCDFTSGLF
ncbi:RHS repeat-associated core domain-containing protein [Zhouia amylolytica]|uniref:RHS repeat-associated core domain-containing protein n=1 Tax=Zhouia amylolytica TaxID=376730 RepID=A0A1I6RM04_9FLAO|nr:RHS repeat-associated core domain-containing protein [Zhouia amylolytica]SFS65735.1 RHS repeat-associated core domain-containing protein [Zhouia amylolytica]